MVVDEEHDPQFARVDACFGVVVSSAAVGGILAGETVASTLGVTSSGWDATDFRMAPETTPRNNAAETKTAACNTGNVNESAVTNAA